MGHVARAADGGRGARPGRMFEGDVRVETAWSKRRGKMLIVAGTAAGMLIGPRFGGRELAGMVAAMVGLALAGWLHGKTRTFEKRRAVAGHDGLRIADDMTVPRASIVEATTHPKRTDRVVIRRPGGSASDLELELAGAEEARQLIDALELDVVDASAEERTFALTGGAYWTLFLLLPVALLMLLVGLPAGSLALSAGGAVVAAAALGSWWVSRRPTLQVGGEGLYYGTRWRARYIPYRDVAEIDAVVAKKGHIAGASSWSSLVITKLDGTKTKIRVAQPYREQKRVGGVVGIQAAIERALDAFRAAAEPNAEALRRGEDETGAWLSKLRELSEKTDYRKGALTDDGLRELASSAKAPRSARAAAAVMLRLRSEEAELSALRIATDDVADPQLRDALRIAIEADSERELLAALELVADERAREQRA